MSFQAAEAQEGGNEQESQEEEGHETSAISEWNFKIDWQFIAYRQEYNVTKIHSRISYIAERRQR